MQLLVFAVFMCYFCVQDVVKSVKILELRVPSHLAEGRPALLGCHYDLEGEELYNVKWFKDHEEFFRYEPRRHPPARAYSRAQVEVDVLRSSATAVALRPLTQGSGGLYSCEVCGEAPRFSADSQERNVTMHFLPQSPPVLSGQQSTYAFGDRLVINCTSSASRPEAHLRWWLNDQPVPRRHQPGPWSRVGERPDTTETILQLRFTVAEKHFLDGLMRIKCQSTIAPLYQEEVALTFAQEVVSPPPMIAMTSEPWGHVTSEPWRPVDDFYRVHFQPSGDEVVSSEGTEVGDISSAISSNKVIVISTSLCLMLILN